MNSPFTPITKNIPPWMDDQTEKYLARFKAYEPFPFNQPTDIENYLCLHQNDYLRLSNHPEVIEAKNLANTQAKSISMFSAALEGDVEEHKKLRDAISTCMSVEDVLLTTAGWTANVGLVEAVTKPEMPVYIDYQAHASLWDGARLAGGKIIPIRHNDPTHLAQRIKKYGRGIVCIDAIYSTDGSIPDLLHYVEICEENECFLILDEAHSFGVLGSRGGGLAVELGLEERIPVRTVSMSKALGGHGGFIAASAEFLWYLKHRSRSVIFSSSTSPAASAGANAALNIAIREPERSQRCLEMAALLRKLLMEKGIDTGLSNSQIISLYFDQDGLAANFYGYMQKLGILISVFTAPAVPRDTSLARFSLHCEITPSDIQKVATAVVESIHAMGVQVKPPYSAFKKI